MSDEDVDAEDRKARMVQFLSTELILTVRVKRAGRSHPRTIRKNAVWELPAALNKQIIAVLVENAEETLARRQKRHERAFASTRDGHPFPKPIQEAERKLLISAKANVASLKEVQEFLASPNMTRFYEALVDVIDDLPREEAT